MTQDEIIEMAKQSDLGFLFNENWLMHEEIKRFANLVAQHEREECAKACENIYSGEEACGDWPTPEMCAEAIRERGNK